MEDLPKPTSPETAAKNSRPISRDLPMRQGVKLNNIVELEQVKCPARLCILFLLALVFNY